MKPRPRFIAARVFEREQSHRRSVLAAMGLLFVFSMSPVFGHHVAEPLTAALAGRDHLLNLCLVALHELLAPVHNAFHVLVAVGVLYAVADRIRAAHRLKSTLRLLEFRIPEAESHVGQAAAAVGVDHRCLRVVTGPCTPAFTAGLWRPRIFVASDLANRIAIEELSAVIAHEDAHRRRRDPLRLTLWRVFSCTLFFLPILRRLAQDMSDEAEVAADDEAVARGRVQPLILASALLNVANRMGGPRFRGVAATAFHRDDMLGRRVRRLAGVGAPVGTHLTRRSVLGAVVALTAVWVSGAIVAHPLPGAASPASIAGQASHDPSHHCSHAHAWAISHLFCRGGFDGAGSPSAAQRPASRDCPHAARG